MNNKKKYFEGVFIALAALFIYFSSAKVEVAILGLLGLEVETLSTTFKTIYLIVFETIEMLLIIALFWKVLKENIEDLKKNHEKYFKKYFPYWLIILMIMAASNLLIMLLTEKEMSGNEEAVRELLVKSPIYMYFSGVIFAPIVEELLFRRGIRNIIKPNTLFILVSGFVFGGLHIVTGYTGVMDLLYLIPYCAPGIIFAYILTKTDNVLVTMSIHFMHNGILIALEMLVYLFLT